MTSARSKNNNLYGTSGFVFLKQPPITWTEVWRVFQAMIGIIRARSLTLKQGTCPDIHDTDTNVNLSSGICARISELPRRHILTLSGSCKPRNNFQSDLLLIRVLSQMDVRYTTEWTNRPINIQDIRQGIIDTLEIPFVSLYISYLCIKPLTFKFGKISIFSKWH